MRRLLGLLGVGAFLASGCTPATPPPSSPSPSPSPSALAAVGPMKSSPFPVRSVTMWRDATAAWISFDETVPATDGHFDPRARRRTGNAFVLSLEPAFLAPGTWAARSGQIPKDSVIKDVVLQTTSKDKPGEIHLDDRGWSCTLTLTRVIGRVSKTGMAGTDVVGTVRIDAPGGHLEGPFIGHDVLRDDEVGPDQPSVPAPTP